MSKEGKYTTIHYQQYLGLDKLLSTQVLRSEELGDPAHEEILFIITHQVYELWFKQIIHELKSVIAMFSEERLDMNRANPQEADMHEVNNNMHKANMHT